MLRTLVERLSRGIVLRRQLPREFGGSKLFVSPDAALRFWLPSLSSADPLLLRLAREFVEGGNRVWDVGANVGLFTFCAASRAGAGGEVLAIEPDPFLASLLRRSASRQKRGTAVVRVLPAAITDRNGPISFRISARGRALNAVAGAGRDERAGSRADIWVGGLTLDSCLRTFRAPQFVKIDVEGHEAAVLAGGTELLRQHRPRLVIEVGSSQQQDVARILAGLGYQFFDGTLPTEERTVLSMPPWTCVALHKHDPAMSGID